MPRTIRLSLLGRFEARRPDGKPANLASKKARALLTYLAVESDRAHSREHLATLLWSETGEERARHNLRQSLSKIRQCCGGVILADDDTLRIDPKSSVDVGELERLASAQGLDQLREALALYRGELLEETIPREIPFEEWLMGARRRLRSIACKAADRLAALLAADEKVAEAIEVLERRLAMDPASEPAHLELMKLLVRAGRRSDALRQYQSCAEALGRELGAEPGAKTRAFYDGIRKPGAGTEPEPGRGDAEPANDVAQGRPTVAVLPFDNLSGPDEAYFADGIAEDIITALSCFKSLFVISRGTSFAYRDRGLAESRIASEIGAQFLVRGSVRRAGGRVRINVQLLEAAGGLNLWGARYDREMKDVFEIQDEITSTVVSTLAGRVEAARLERARKAPPERLEAYDFLLRGKELHHRYTPEDCARCIDMFEMAIERDPDYAAAHAWRACGLGQAITFDLDEKDNLVEKSQASAERGLDLDPNESECHRILAQVHLMRKNLKRALWHQERALALNPNDDRSVCSMGEILTYAGKHGEAEGWIRKAMRLNPCHPDRYWTHLARALFHLGRHTEALEALERIRRPRPDDLLYSAAAASRLGDAKLLERLAADLRRSLPGDGAADLVESLPYERAEERDALIGALRESRLLR